MSDKLSQKIREWERKKRESYSHDIVDPKERKKSKHYNDWVDHGILRYHWHNFAEIAPGIYRSNHPNHARFKAYADMGVKTVLNLRGATNLSYYNFEVESCKVLGLELIDLQMSARAVPPKDKLLTLMDVLEQLDSPTLMHCKSGADRTGLASAIYLMHVLGKPVKEAQRMLSLRFVHLNFTKTGILDYVIDLYAKRVQKSEISFREWVETEYDPETTFAEFKAMGFWKRLQL